MHAPDSRNLLLQKLNRVAAAIYVVTRIEAKAQLIRGEQREKAVNLLGSFHVAADVVVKGYPQSERLAALEDFADRYSGRLPLCITPGDLIGIATAPRRCIPFRGGHVGKHQEPRAGFADQFRRTGNKGQAGGMCSFVAEFHVDKRGTKRERSLRQFVAKCGGIGGKESIGTEFGPGVAGGFDFVQNPVIGIVRGELDMLHDSPVDRCASYLDRHPSTFLSKEQASS